MNIVGQLGVGPRPLLQKSPVKESVFCESRAFGYQLYGPFTQTMSHGAQTTESWHTFEHYMAAGVGSTPGYSLFCPFTHMNESWRTDN